MLSLLLYQLLYSEREAIEPHSYHIKCAYMMIWRRVQTLLYLPDLLVLPTALQPSKVNVFLMNLYGPPVDVTFIFTPLERGVLEVMHLGFTGAH
ncbi:hypothetical protein FKM82_005997 [Ascaphus truei]